MDNFRDSYFQVDWDLTTKRLRGTYWGKQYDTGRGFAVTVINGGQVVAPTTEVLRLKWEKPDNTTGYVNATIVNGKFIIENIDQMFTVQGSVRADFELSVGGEFVASITFYVSVEKAVAVDAVASSSQFTALQDAVGSVDSLQQQFNNVVANVTVDSEVITARGTETTLGARLDSTDENYATLTQDYTQHKLNYAQMNNLLVNSGFTNDTNGWVSTFTSATTSDGILTLVSSGNIRSIRQSVPFINEHKYYIKAKVKPLSSLSLLMRISASFGVITYPQWSTKFDLLAFNGILNEWAILSDIITVDNDYDTLSFVTYPNAGEYSYEIDYIFALDLTDIFGAGYEWDKNKMDSLVNSIPVGYWERNIPNKYLIRYLISDKGLDGLDGLLIQEGQSWGV